MILIKEDETLSDNLMRWSLSFNENLSLDKKDGKTIESYMNTVNKFIEYVSSHSAIDNLTFRDIDTKFIKRYFSWRDEDFLERADRELKPSTKLNDKKILIIFFSYIEDENDERFEFSIKWKKITYEKENTEVVHIPPEMIESILKYLEQNIKSKRTEFSYMLSFTFKLALYGGLRASEICDLRLSRFGEVYTPKNSKVKLIPLMIHGKMKSKLTNPIPYEYIKNELNYFKRNKESKDKTMFLSKTGTELNRVQLYHYFEEISDNLGLGKRGVHIVRRTFANRLVELGVDIRNVQLLMRHKDIKTTIIYTRRSQSQMDITATKM